MTDRPSEIAREPAKMGAVTRRTSDGGVRHDTYIVINGEEVYEFAHIKQVLAEIWSREHRKTAGLEYWKEWHDNWQENQQS